MFYGISCSEEDQTSNARIVAENTLLYPISKEMGKYVQQRCLENILPYNYLRSFIYSHVALTQLTRFRSLPHKFSKQNSVLMRIVDLDYLYAVNIHHIVLSVICS